MKAYNNSIISAKETKHYAEPNFEKYFSRDEATGELTTTEAFDRLPEAARVQILLEGAAYLPPSQQKSSDKDYDLEALLLMDKCGETDEFSFEESGHTGMIGLAITLVCVFLVLGGIRFVLWYLQR